MTPRRKNGFAGKRIVITRSASAGKEWADYFRRRGAIVRMFPTIKTAPVTPTKKLAHVLAHLDSFAWIVFTSPAGPYYTKELMEKLRPPAVSAQAGTQGKYFIKKKNVTLGSRLRANDRGVLNDLMSRIAVIGRKTASAVHDIGWPVAFMPKSPTSAALARKLKPFRSPILLLRADIASKEISRTLESRGAQVTDIAIYKTSLLRRKADPKFLRSLRDKRIDYLTFASPSAVRGFCERLKGSDAMASARRIPAVALGATVAQALRRAKFRDVRIARTATVKGVADAMLGKT